MNSFRFSARNTDLIQDLYIKELKAYKPPAPVRVGAVLVRLIRASRFVPTQRPCVLCLTSRFHVTYTCTY